MANVVGKIPEFTGDDQQPSVKGDEVSGESPEKADPEEGSEEEKETPTGQPTAEKPVDLKKEAHDDTAVSDELKGVLGDKAKVAREIRELESLRLQRQKLREEETLFKKKQADDLKDLNPSDIDLIDRVVRQRGFVTVEEMNQTFYESVRQEEVNRFLEKWPEFKAENDPGDVRWLRLKSVVDQFKQPSDPHQYQEILEMSRKFTSLPISGDGGDRGVEAKKKQVQIASTGGGGVQRSSSSDNRKSFTPEERWEFERGGWSKEEIDEMELNRQK